MVFVIVLHIPVDGVDLCGDAVTAGQGHKEDVARMAVGLAGFQYAKRGDGNALWIEVVIDFDVLFHPIDNVIHLKLGKGLPPRDNHFVADTWGINEWVNPT